MRFQNMSDLTRLLGSAFSAVFLACFFPGEAESQGIKLGHHIGWPSASLLASKESQVREHPNSKKDLEDLAEMYRYSQRPADAEKQLLRSIALRESDKVVDLDGLSNAYSWLGRTQFAQHKYVEAESSYERCIGLCERRHHQSFSHRDNARWRKIVALDWLTECYADHGDKQSALKTYQRLVAADRTPGECHENFADISRKLRSIGLSVVEPHPYP